MKLIFYKLIYKNIFFYFKLMNKLMLIYGKVILLIFTYFLKIFYRKARNKSYILLFYLFN